MTPPQAPTQSLRCRKARAHAGFDGSRDRVLAFARADFSENRFLVFRIMLDCFSERRRTTTLSARRGALPERLCRQEFLLLWVGNETFTLRLLARELARPPNGFRPFAHRSLGWLLEEPALLHLPKDAFALHLLFQDAEGLIDVVVADEDLQWMFLLLGIVKASVAERAQFMRSAGRGSLRYSLLSISAQACATPEFGSLYPGSVAQPPLLT